MTLGLLLSTGAPPHVDMDANQNAFEMGYLLRAHTEFCAANLGAADGELLHTLEGVIRKKLRTNKLDPLTGACPLVYGRTLRSAMTVRAGAYELLGETVFDAESMTDPLPAPLLLIFRDISSHLNEHSSVLALKQFERNPRNANELHVTLFGGALLPFHEQIQRLRRKHVQK